MDEEEAKAFAALGGSLANLRQAIRTHNMLSLIGLAGLALNLGVLVWIEFRWITAMAAVSLAGVVIFNYLMVRKHKRFLLKRGLMCPSCHQIANVEHNYLITEHRLDCQWMGDPNSEPYP